MRLVGEDDPLLQVPEWAQELFDGYLMWRQSGMPPWEMGIRVGRRRFWEAARIFSRVFGQAEIMRLRAPGCALLGGR